MTEALVTATKHRATRSAALLRAAVVRGWRRLVAGSSPEHQPTVALPSWDDATLADSLTALANLTEDECREFLASLYRVVVAYERSGDVRVLTQFAREARTTAQLWARADFREAARRPANPVAPEATLSVGEVLAKLGG
jgi:hypothetical protein